MPITYNETGVTYDSTSYTWEGERYQPSVFPVAGIFVAWDDGPYVANPVWTEVTTDVRAFQTHRGRSSDFDQFEAGTAQITFDNRNRKYDPFYTAGSLYGKLLPRRQVRVVAQIGGLTYEVFRGFIAGWPVTWSEYGKDSTVTVQCFDALGLMINEQVPTDWYQYYIQQLVPRRYWKCNDSQTTQRIRDRSTNTRLSDLIPFGPADRFFEDTPISDGLIGSSMFMTNSGNSPIITGQTANPVDTTITLWTRYRPGSGSAASFYYSNQGLLISSEYNVSTNVFGIYIDNRTNFRRYSCSAAALPSNTPVFIALRITANAGGTPTGEIYINNVLQSTTTTTGATGGVFLEEFAQFANNQQEIAIFDGLLSTTNMTLLYNIGFARLSETTSARMDRILGTTSWPAALESFPAAPVGTVAEIGSGNGVIAELQLVADSEGGEIYVAKNGVLTMTARRDVFNATRSKNVQATITDSGAGVRYGSEVEIMYDADNLKNDVTVNFSGDGEVFATNAVTIAAYGANAATIETQLDSPTSATDLATLELGVEGVLVPQVSPLDVSANTAAADWQAILSLELLDRVNFRRTPTVGNQFSRDALINAIDHQVEPGQWRTQLTLSMRYTSPLTLDDSVLGRVDYNYLG